MIGTSILTFVLGMDGSIGRGDGMLLVAGGIAYTAFLIRESHKENKGLGQGDAASQGGGRARPSPHSWRMDAACIVCGLGLLVLGARWLVQAAVSIAQFFGVGELVIGLTIVAAGTSLPEVATSIVASIRGQRDIAVGNVVGSNIFNVLAVLGLSGIVAPRGIDVSATALELDIPVMIAVSIACLPVFFTGHVIARWEGALFLGCYAAYTCYLVLVASQHAALPVFGRVMLWFAMPLTVLTLAVVTVRSLRAGQGRDEAA